MLALEGLGPRGTAPAGTAPALAPGAGLEQGAQRALEPRHQHGGAQRRHEAALVVVASAERPMAIGSHHAVDTGTRTEQKRGDLSGGVTGGTAQQHVQREHITGS